jgi:molybdate transport system substrate-binding protein
MRFLLLCALALASVSGFADEIRVLSGGAARAFVEPAAKSFQGHSVQLDYQPMGRLTQTMASPEAARYDMVVVSEEALEKLKYPGARALARVGIGVAVHEKAPLPDISTPEALRRTLLAAKSVVYINPATGTSGKSVVQMFEKLGIAEQMKGKSTHIDQGYAVAPVGRGEVELGIHQISEILPVKGVRLAGPLPAELQKYTVYSGAPVPGTPKLAAVQQFIAHLTSSEAKGRLASAGYSAPE